MKSSEWGAVVYLSISKYGYSEGTSEKEKAKNNVRITGVTNPNYSSWQITAITGYSAPTGKAAENAVAYSSESSLGDSVSGTNGISNYLSTAYPYNPVTTDYKDFNSGYNGTGWNEIFGDALWETSSGTGAGKAWFGQTLEEDGSSEEPFFPRGGNWNSAVNVGLCGLSDDSGSANGNCGFHSVLVVE